MRVQFCTSGPPLFVQWVRRDSSLAPGNTVTAVAPLRMCSAIGHSWSIAAAEGASAQRVIELLPVDGPSQRIDIATGASALPPKGMLTRCLH